jgi:hypothetical protein
MGRSIVSAYRRYKFIELEEGHRGHFGKWGLQRSMSHDLWKEGE